MDPEKHIAVTPETKEAEQNNDVQVADIKPAEVMQVDKPTLFMKAEMFYALSREMAIASAVSLTDLDEGSSFCIALYDDPLPIANPGLIGPPSHEFFFGIDKVVEQISNWKKEGLEHMAPLIGRLDLELTEFVNEVMAVYLPMKGKADSAISDWADIEAYWKGQWGERYNEHMSSLTHELVRRVYFGGLDTRINCIEGSTCADETPVELLAMNRIDPILVIDNDDNLEVENGEPFSTLPLDIRKSIIETTLYIKSNEQDIIQYLKESENSFARCYPFQKGIRSMTVITNKQILRVACSGDPMLDTPLYVLTSARPR